LPSFLSAHALLSIPALGAFQLHLTPFNSTPTIALYGTTLSVKNMRGHQAFVNSCAPSTRGDPLVISGSDDGTAKLWDLRRKHAVRTFPHRFQVTAVAFSKDASQVYTGGVDNVLRAYDVRKEDAPYLTLPGHTDTITGIAPSPDGTHVLTNAMDCTLRMWDVQPYASGDRCVKYFTGHSHNFEKTLLRCSWSADGTRVSAGSSCANVFVWDVDSRRVLYKLPGHGGTVGEVAFHPKEPVIASGSADHKIYLGELAD
jgi:Prp8 binding protein